MLTQNSTKIESKKEKIEHLLDLVLSLIDNCIYAQANITIINTFLPKVIPDSAKSDQVVNEFIIFESASDLDEILIQYKDDLNKILAKIRSLNEIE